MLYTYLGIFIKLHISRHTCPHWEGFRHIQDPGITYSSDVKGTPSVQVRFLF